MRSLNFLSSYLLRANQLLSRFMSILGTDLPAIYCLIDFSEASLCIDIAAKIYCLFQCLERNCVLNNAEKDWVATASVYINLSHYNTSSFWSYECRLQRKNCPQFMFVEPGAKRKWGFVDGFIAKLRAPATTFSVLYKISFVDAGSY